MRSRAPAPPRTAQWARHTWSRGRPRSTPGGETWARNLTPLPSLRNASLSVALPTRRPQIARSMRLRLTLLVATWLPALTGGANLAAQEASPYVPLGHWVMPYVEHLIAAGVIRDPTPLTRPFRQGDLVRALEAVDTQPLSRATRATLHQLEAALGNGQRVPHVRVEGGVGAAAANYARRGPPGIEGWLLSANPYGLDHLALAVGTPKIQLQALATQLDDRDSSGTVVHRYMMQHRLVFTPGRWGLALWEGSVLSGTARSFELWYLNPLNSGILEQWNNGGNVNSFVGLDFERRGTVTLFGQLMLDDIQVDRASATDKKPVSYAFNVGTQGAVGGAATAWRAWYTRVTNLTYRNENDLQVPLYHLLGTGRNFDDYEQLTVTLGLLPRAGFLLTPELTVLRQGEGDPRQPHPPVTPNPTTPTTFQAVVDRTLPAAVPGTFLP